jgi:hypothetical protein
MMHGQKTIKKRDLNVYSAVVTMCTAKFNIQKFCILPTMYLRVFLRISEQTAIISVYNIN